MSKNDFGKSNPVSSRMSQYSERNGKPNAHVVNDQKAGAKAKSNPSSRSTSGKSGGCNCG